MLDEEATTAVRHSTRGRDPWTAANRIASERMEAAQTLAACGACARCRCFDRADDLYDPSLWCDAARELSQAEQDFDDLIPACPDDGVCEGHAWERELVRIDQRARAMIGRTRVHHVVREMLAASRRPAMRASRPRVTRSANTKASTGDPDPEPRLAARLIGGAS